MSGAGDGRWRQSSSRERPNRQSVGGGTNAWAQRDTKAKGSPNPPQQRNAQPSAAASPTPAPRSEHIPVKGFNAAETKQFLKKSYQDTIKAAGENSLWKSQEKQAWGTRTDRMAGNRDFWLLLRREVGQAEQVKAPSTG